MTTVIHLTTSTDYDVAPGTVHIVNTQTETGSKAQVRLIPHPSSNFSDPLRWHRWRKHYHLLLLVAYSAIFGAVTNWESPIYLVLAEAFDAELSTLNVGSALMLLMLGVGNVFLTPLSIKFGRRFVYLLSLLVGIIAYVWLSVAQNAEDYIGAHVLLGIAAAPFEALPAISITDVFFTHERGTMMSLYVFGLALGSFVGPICSGYMFPAMGFRWVYRWGAIMMATLFVFMFFTLEESHFQRPASEEVSVSTEEASDSETAVIFLGEKDKKRTNNNLERITTSQESEIVGANPFRVQWRLYKVYPGTFQQYCCQCFQPLLCFWFPGILWTGINYGTCVSWLAVLGSTSAFVFAPPPYFFSTDALGLIWLSTLIGSIIGAIYSGSFNDKLALWLARRNHGWREPEYRLWAFLPGALIMPGGIILYGVGAASGLPWIAPVFGMGLIGFGLSIGGTVGISYVIDCYRDIDGEAVTTVILIRNIIGFGISFGIQQWIEGMGLQNCFVMIGCLSFAITGFAGLFIVFGKRWRKYTEIAYTRLVASRA